MQNSGIKRTVCDPCARHGCHICCLDTRMTLTEADLGRLDGAGFKNFARLNADGDIELRNLDGRCVFLLDGRCEAYTARPEGCRLYPLVLDVGSGRVVRDRLCPHREAFPITMEQVDRLRRSVEHERIEAGNRRRGEDV